MPIGAVRHRSSAFRRHPKPPNWVFAKYVADRCCNPFFEWLLTNHVQRLWVHTAAAADLGNSRLCARERTNCERPRSVLCLWVHVPVRMSHTHPGVLESSKEEDQWFSCDTCTFPSLSRDAVDFTKLSTVFASGSRAGGGPVQCLLATPSTLRFVLPEENELVPHGADSVHRERATKLRREGTCIR